ncbi:MAG: hypothetical protein JRG90_16530 [Deltaproteobacteria bacterium]|nr:hypothetical protein [Deltaproteobacteria bacterium]
MLKYYIFLFLIVGIGLFYVFIKDPCNRQLETDFSNKHPSYKILNSGASEGSPESVRCHISYRKPDSEQIYEDIWLYQDSGRGWEFSRILVTGKTEQTDGDRDAGPRIGDAEAAPQF